MSATRIAIDAMGGDHAPTATVRGALDALSKDDVLEVVLVGAEQALQSALAAANAPADGRLVIRHASQVVASTDSASSALRLPDSSIKRAAELLRDGQVHGLVAAGHTGAAVAAGTLIVGLLPGVRRPGIAVTLPTAQGLCVLTDAGANIHCKPLHLFHYAIMARRYAELALGIEAPTVGLLNVGEEEGKGTELLRETTELLSSEKARLNFIGNVEGHDIFAGKSRVVVCEGFVGNVVLKTSEGLYELISGRVRHMLNGLAERLSSVPGVAEQLGGAFTAMKAKMDWADHGGAPLLGLKGLLLIAHGRSDARAISNAILQAARFHRSGALEAMGADVVRSST